MDYALILTDYTSGKFLKDKILHDFFSLCSLLFVVVLKKYKK